MRVMTRTALRKVEKASSEDGNTGSPTKSTPKSGSRKRKPAAEGDGDRDDVEETPSKKKRGRKPKADKADDAEATGKMLSALVLSVSVANSYLEEPEVKDESDDDLV